MSSNEPYTVASAADHILLAAQDLRVQARLLDESRGEPSIGSLEHLRELVLRLAAAMYDIEGGDIASDAEDPWSEISGLAAVLAAVAIALGHSLVDRSEPMDIPGTRLQLELPRWLFCNQAVLSIATRVHIWAYGHAAAAEEVASDRSSIERTDDLRGQGEVDCLTREHLKTITTLLETIGDGGSAMASEGYIEGGAAGDPERFTGRGWKMVDSIRAVAKESAGILWDLENRTPTRLEKDLLRDVQGFFAVTASALNGLTRALDGTEAATAPCWVVYKLMCQARDLQKRAEAEARDVSGVEAEEVAHV